MPKYLRCEEIMTIQVLNEKGEATFSALDRRTGVKHLRVRGMPAVRFAVVLKALGLNLLRAGRRLSGGRKTGNPGSTAVGERT